MKKRMMVVAGVMGVALTACGSTTTQAAVVTTTTSASGAASTSTTASPTTTAAVAHVGATEAVKDQSGHAYTVQVTSITDPATPATQFDAPTSGDRLVAVNLVLTNKSSAVIQDDADSNVTVIGSDNQTYQPSFNSVTGCTDFNSGQYTLTPGGSSSGCVVVELPSTVKIDKVMFEPTSFLNSVVATWVVP
ncbi:MAG: hypothetical protein ACP5PJ_01070 [Acidimicrobiales bacterium]